jgi:hypothetical protein
MEPIKLGKGKPLTPELCELHNQAEKEIDSERAAAPKKHFLIESAEQIVRDRDKYKHQTYINEAADLYSMFYGALTSIMDYKQAPSKKVKEVEEMMKALEAARAVIREEQ